MVMPMCDGLMLKSVFDQAEVIWWHCLAIGLIATLNCDDGYAEVRWITYFICSHVLG